MLLLGIVAKRCGQEFSCVIKENARAHQWNPTLLPPSDAFPRVKNLNPEAGEILDVAGRHCEAVLQGGCPDQPSIVASGVPRCCIRADSTAQRSATACVTGSSRVSKERRKSCSSHSSRAARRLPGSQSSMPCLISARASTLVKRKRSSVCRSQRLTRASGSPRRENPDKTLVSSSKPVIDRRRASNLSTFEC